MYFYYYTLIYVPTAKIGKNLREQLKHRRIVEYEKVKVKTAMNNFSSDIHSGIYYKQNNKSTHILSKIFPSISYNISYRSMLKIPI